MRRAISLALSIELPAALRRRAELVAVLTTGALHLTWGSTGLPRAVFTVTACVLWLGYVLRRWSRDPTSLPEWGFRLDNLVEASRAPLLLTAIAGPAMLLYGWLVGHPLPAHVVFPLLLYPVWGVVQQFLVQGLVTANLRGLGLRTPTVVGVSALCFGLVHFTEPLLIPATFALGLLFTPLYLQHRNLWTLGVAHGWLGTLFYYAVLGRDPWLEVWIG